MKPEDNDRHFVERFGRRLKKKKGLLSWWKVMGDMYLLRTLRSIAATKRLGKPARKYNKPIRKCH